MYLFWLFTISNLFLADMNAFLARKHIKIQNTKTRLYQRRFELGRASGASDSNRTGNLVEFFNGIYSLQLLSPEDDPNHKKKTDILFTPNPFSEFQLKEDPDHPLYTVFWKRCDECTKLLEEMEAIGLRVVFIDGKEIFDIIWDEPIVYKNQQVLVGWFDIYEAIFQEPRFPGRPSF
jgi:hypothetical protein